MNGDQYEHQKELFINKLTDFIRDQTKFSTEEVISKLKTFIDDYSRYYNDDKNDQGMIDSLQKDLGWYNNILKSKVILKKEVKVEEQKEIKKAVTALQFKYQTSLWRKLFNQNSFNNDLYGQILFHVTLGVITDVKVPVKNNRSIWARPSLFYIQRSRSGKNEGMYFVVDVLKQMHKKVIQNGKIAEYRSIEILQLGKQTDPTLLNRYIMINNKGTQDVKKDMDGKPIILKGKLEQSDLVWQPEANYLLNPTSYNDEAINIHLNLLESDGKYTKELQQWGGRSTTTKGGHYALVAITRPVEDIKKHIAYNGLLQRCVFMPRHLTRQERRSMLESVALNLNKKDEQKQEYQKDFKCLINNLEEIQDFCLKNKVKIKNEDIDIYTSEFHKKLMYFDELIQKSCSIESNKEIFEDFLANYGNIITMIAYQSAMIRKSKWVELVDLEYAFNFFSKSFNMMMPWIEESVEATKSELNKMNLRKNAMYKIKSQIGIKVKVSEAIKFIQKDLRISYPTAKSILQDFSEQGPFRMVAIDWRNKIVVFL